MKQKIELSPVKDSGDFDKRMKANQKKLLGMFNRLTTEKDFHKSTEYKELNRQTSAELRELNRYIKKLKGK